jgi:hypothetical protein
MELEEEEEEEAEEEENKGSVASLGPTMTYEMIS